MPELNVPGASLHYEVIGDGPVLLCIHGGNGSGDKWRGVGEALKGRFRVAFYDRKLSPPNTSTFSKCSEAVTNTKVHTGRGFSQSHLNGPQDYSHRLQTDADDAALLLKHLSPGSPASVIGSSSGGIVALKLLTRHPSLIHKLLAHEPPAARFLSDFEALKKEAEDVYATYRAGGLIPGFARFVTLIKAADDEDGGRVVAQNMMAGKDVGHAYNLTYWFERELLVYPVAEFDVEGELRPWKGKLVLVNGEESNREAYQFRANVALAAKLGVELVMFPGEHFGYVTRTGEFAERLGSVLEGV